LSRRVAEEVRPLDSDWLRAHPLPVPDNAADKNSRGRVLAIGGSATVPGGIQLTVEAALRAGASKIQVVSVESAPLSLGIAMPEVAVCSAAESCWRDCNEKLGSAFELLGNVRCCGRRAGDVRW